MSKLERQPSAEANSIHMPPAPMQEIEKALDKEVAEAMADRNSVYRNAMRRIDRIEAEQIAWVDTEELSAIYAIGQAWPDFPRTLVDLEVFMPKFEVEAEQRKIRLMAHEQRERIKEAARTARDDLRTSWGASAIPAGYIKSPAPKTVIRWGHYSPKYRRVRRVVLEPCTALTLAGNRCKNPSVDTLDVCRVHSAH